VEGLIGIKVMQSRQALKMNNAGSAGRSVMSMILLALASAGAAAYVSTLGAKDVPHGKLSQFNWVALPEFGGKEAIIYRSPDGKRVAAAFHESGSPSFTYSFDEFLIVTSGFVTVHVHGGSTFTLHKEDVAYFREGMSVDFQFSDDFSDITSLVADHEVKWR
jgi:uncharacterized cupin superfamily protein